MRYFAYGSNMCHFQMADRCPDAAVIGPAVLEGWRFMINGRGVATIIPEAGARVRGLLWTLPPSCERSLDRYEGVVLGHYRRETMLVGDAPALVYLAARTDPGPPRPGYLERILAAVERLDYDPDYIAELRSFGMLPPP